MPSHLLAVVFLLLVTVAVSNADHEFNPSYLAGLCALVLGGLWCLHAVIYFFHTATMRLKAPLGRVEIAAWFVLPLIVVIAAGMCKTRLPLRVRFRLSEAALLAATEGERESGRAGLYTFDRWSFDNDLPHLKTCSFIFSDGGFVYSPDGRPFAGDNPALTYRHFRGGWYTWHSSD